MSRMNLAKLQIMRGNQNGSGDEGGRQMRYGRDEPWEPDHRRMTYTPPYGAPDMRRHYDIPEDRRMGFGENDGYDTEMRRRRRSDGTFMHYGGGEDREREPIQFGGMVSMSGGSRRGGHHKLTREMAEAWVESMESSDPAKPHGAKWTMEQIKPIAQKYGVPTEGERFWEFWAVVNAMYSDYYPVAKKYNALSADFFADMAMAFIGDKDAVENKAAVYYECIVEK